MLKLSSFLNAIKYDSKSIASYLDLASIYRAQKNYDEAIKSLVTAIGMRQERCNVQATRMVYLHARTTKMH